MKPKEILLSSTCIASCITAIGLLIYFRSWPWLVYACVVFSTVFLFVAGVLIYWNSVERRAIRNAAIKLIVAGILFVGKAAFSGGLRLWLTATLNSNSDAIGDESDLDAVNGTVDVASGTFDGTIGWLANSEPTVDCLLVVAGVVLCGLGVFLLSSLVNGKNDLNSSLRPQVTWDKLQSFKGCVNYLVQQVKGNSEKQTAEMQELLTDCFFAADPSDWNQVVENHKFGKRKAKILLMGAIGRFIVEFNELNDLHGSILKPLGEIENRIRLIRRG